MRTRIRNQITAPVSMTRLMIGWIFATVILSTLGVSVAGVAYTHAEQRRADKRWCDLLETMDTPVPSNVQDPVQKHRSEKIQRGIREQRKSLGCI